MQAASRWGAVTQARHLPNSKPTTYLLQPQFGPSQPARSGAAVPLCCWQCCRLLLTPPLHSPAGGRLPGKTEARQLLPRMQVSRCRPPKHRPSSSACIPPPCSHRRCPVDTTSPAESATAETVGALLAPVEPLCFGFSQPEKSRGLPGPQGPLSGVWSSLAARPPRRHQPWRRLNSHRALPGVRTSLETPVARSVYQGGFQAFRQVVD